MSIDVWQLPSCSRLTAWIHAQAMWLQTPRSTEPVLQGTRWRLAQNTHGYTQNHDASCVFSQDCRRTRPSRGLAHAITCDSTCNAALGLCRAASSIARSSCSRISCVAALQSRVSHVCLQHMRHAKSASCPAGRFVLAAGLGMRRPQSVPDVRQAALQQLQRD